MKRILSGFSRPSGGLLFWRFVAVVYAAILAMVALVGLVLLQDVAPGVVAYLEAVGDRTEVRGGRFIMHNFSGVVIVFAVIGGICWIARHFLSVLPFREEEPEPSAEEAQA